MSKKRSLKAMLPFVVAVCLIVVSLISLLSACGGIPNNASSMPTTPQTKTHSATPDTPTSTATSIVTDLQKTPSNAVKGDCASNVHVSIAEMEAITQTKLQLNPDPMNASTSNYCQLLSVASSHLVVVISYNVYPTLQETNNLWATVTVNAPSPKFGMESVAIEGTEGAFYDPHPTANSIEFKKGKLWCIVSITRQESDPSSLELLSDKQHVFELTRLVASRSSS